MKNEFLILYSNNLPVKGKTQSCIYALGQGQLHVISNSFYEIINELRSVRYEVVRRRYNSQSAIFESYINYLLKENLAFFTLTPKMFPALELDYKSPEIITSIIAEYDFTYRFEKLVIGITACNCKYLLLSLPITIEGFYQVESLLMKLEGSTLRKVDLVFNANQDITSAQVKMLIEKYKKIGLVTICNSNFQKVDRHDNVTIFYFKSTVAEYMTESRLENVFLLNISFFIEAQKHNPYYNKKAYVNCKGDIKNGQFTNEKFGNINQDNLERVVQRKDFQRLWTIIPPVLAKSEFRYCLYNPKGKLTIHKFMNCKKMYDDNNEKYIQQMV